MPAPPLPRQPPVTSEDSAEQAKGTRRGPTRRRRATGNRRRQVPEQRARREADEPPEHLLGTKARHIIGEAGLAQPARDASGPTQTSLEESASLVQEGPQQPVERRCPDERRLLGVEETGGAGLQAPPIGMQPQRESRSSPCGSAR